MIATIDLNADLGEGEPSDDELLRIVSSCNIACGGHAGDADSMAATLHAAVANNVAAGAHPAYPDREGFGRVSNYLSGTPLYESLTEQVTAIADVAAQMGARLTHVKPHGALYNDAIHAAELAEIIARVTSECPGDLALVGMADTHLQTAAGYLDVRFIAEAFIDRAYEPDGTLVPRSEPGAVHSELSVATTQAARLAIDGEVTARNGDVISVRADTLCIHGDTPGAVEAARAVRDVLHFHGVEIRAVEER